MFIQPRHKKILAITHIWTPFYPFSYSGDIPPLSVAILQKYIFPRRLFYRSSNSPWYAKFGFNKFWRCHEFSFLLSWPETIGKKLWDITLINNVMKTNLWKTFTKTYLSSLGCCSFQKLFHTNDPRHSRAFAPKFHTKQQTSLPNPET
jgi:hypothetical protein